MRVLIIEDSDAYALLVGEMLRDGLAGDVEPIHCAAVASGCEVLLDQRIDVVLTGADDPALGLEAVQAGAQDFLAKRGVDRETLTRSIRYAIERKRSEVRLAEQALQDSLTGLPNRVLLLDRLNLALARAARRPTSVAVLFLDLDRFKTINDSLGHDAGDHLLLEIAGRLRASVRPGDTVARFGGDEFLILCEELTNEFEAIRVAERATQAIAAP